MLVYRTQIVGVAAVFLVLLFFYSVSQYSSFSPTFSSRAPSTIPSSATGLLKDVYNQTLGFQKILAISLPSRTDHRDAFILSTAVTGIKGSFVDGVAGKDVLDKVLPPGDLKAFSSLGNRGSWRAHLNALQQVVDQDLTTALIMEDDVDWDIRVKSQLYEFAGAVNLLTQPLAHGNSEYADPTFPTPRKDLSGHMDIFPGPKLSTIPPKSSPYGDDWDVLWLGHCGARFPSMERDPTLPQGRALINDLTAPSQQHVYLGFGSDEILRTYPNHTRAVSHTAEVVCTLAYAVSQRAARQILYDVGLKALESPFDIMLRKYCDGLGERQVRKCYTAQPSYMAHHRAAGKASKGSDINDWEDKEKADEESATAYTFNVRLSTKMNLQKLVDGDTDYVDQWPDDKEGMNEITW
ncbi:LPS glycosyltransferase [Venturia nashicola]|uniref:LPS glycosyltransferase n=1 Tax=Venturia nashicola TaxID=86259 RepID=A0A4Z1P1S1_9PEZI|nr:LPS glycosyltransferase [Venturia nashicola]